MPYSHRPRIILWPSAIALLAVFAVVIAQRTRKPRFVLPEDSLRTVADPCATLLAPSTWPHRDEPSRRRFYELLLPRCGERRCEALGRAIDARSPGEAAQAADSLRALAAEGARLDCPPYDEHERARAMAEGAARAADADPPDWASVAEATERLTHAAVWFPTPEDAAAMVALARKCRDATLAQFEQARLEERWDDADLAAQLAQTCAASAGPEHALPEATVARLREVGRQFAIDPYAYDPDAEETKTLDDTNVFGADGLGANVFGADGLGADEP